MLLENKNHLIKQKRFLPLGLYLKAPPFFGLFKYVFTLKQRAKGDNREKKKNNLNSLNSILNIQKYFLLEKNERFQYKQIHTYFRNVISDQKKRSAFAKYELKKIALKTLLSVNQNTFLFTPWSFVFIPQIYQGEKDGGYATKASKKALNRTKVKPLKPFFSQKRKVGAALLFSLQAVHMKTDLLAIYSLCPFLLKKPKVNLAFFDQNTPFYSQVLPEFARARINLKGQQANKVNPNKKGTLHNSNGQYAKVGPILFLEKGINSQFTEKTKSFSRIRNRCFLSGRSTTIGKYRLSRICFRYYVNKGLIPGLVKNKN